MFTSNFTPHQPVEKAYTSRTNPGNILPPYFPKMATNLYAFNNMPIKVAQFNFTATRFASSGVRPAAERSNLSHVLQNYGLFPAQ